MQQLLEEFVKLICDNESDIKSLSRDYLSISWTRNT